MEYNKAPTILSAEQLNEVTGGVVSASFPLDSPTPYTLEPSGKVVKNPAASVPERGGVG
jgi:hypothetical protein